MHTFIFPSAASFNKAEKNEYYFNPKGHMLLLLYPIHLPLESRFPYDIGQTSDKVIHYIHSHLAALYLVTHK
jgi:hypothetical protein